MSSCPVCGADRVRLGGHFTGLAAPLRLSVTGPPDRAVMTGPALVVATWVEAPITDIKGIGAALARDLKAAGIPDVVALAGR